ATVPIRYFQTNTDHTRISPAIRVGRQSPHGCASITPPVSAISGSSNPTRSCTSTFSRAPASAIQARDSFSCSLWSSMAARRRDLYSGLGVTVFDGPQGHGFYKGGHDGQTANTLVCLEKSERCVLILANDVRAEAGFAHLVRFILGDTGVPYDWEYGDHAGKS